MFNCRAQLSGWIELEMPALEAGEFHQFGAILGKFLCIHHDSQIVIRRPQTFIEHPVSVLGKGQTVSRIIIPRHGPRLDMRCTNNGGSITGDTATARESASVTVLGTHPDGEACASAFKFCCFCRFRQRLLCSGNHWLGVLNPKTLE